MESEHNVAKWIEKLRTVKVLDELELRILCTKVKEILMEESNVTPVSSPVTVCGDIHGQFFDLIEKLFPTGGEIPQTKYIFIGDFVDRGHHSVETFSLLLSYKLLYPGRITLLRGNHESRQISSMYGFYDEILHKYGNTNPWYYFVEVFDLLPLAATIDDKVFCVHGGLSPDVTTVDQIRMINRKTEIPQEGPLCDLMWSDPDDINGWQMGQRGAGWIFGSAVVNDFNYINGFQLVARAHQLVNEGFKYHFEKKNLVTVWSAPNYSYRCGNIASVMKVTPDSEPHFETFDHSERSNMSTLPNRLVPYFL